MAVHYLCFFLVEIIFLKGCVVRSYTKWVHLSLKKCSKFTLFSKIWPKFIFALCSKIGPKISNILSMVDELNIWFDWKSYKLPIIFNLIMKIYTPQKTMRYLVLLCCFITSVDTIMLSCSETRLQVLFSIVTSCWEKL